MSKAPATSTPLLLRALACEPVERVPVWFMRQAGRYLPEYRERREQVSDFMQLCRTPELCCELALQPLRRYRLDAAIVFSDILTVLDALQLQVGFAPGRGPVIGKPVRSHADVESLPAFNPQELDYVYQAVRLTRQEVSAPLFGFAGAPWTLATYAVEGGSSSDFATIKRMLYRAPETLRALLYQLADAVNLHLRAQVEAGAEVLQIFDTWGGILPHHLWREFALLPAQRAAQNLPVPVVFFTRGGGLWLREMRDVGFKALGVDWNCDLGTARALLAESAPRTALQGNLDPDALQAPDQLLEKEVLQVLQSHPGPGHIFNLGHGVRPGTDPDKLAVVLDTVRGFAEPSS